jgi:hypothetical protein
VKRPHRAAASGALHRCYWPEQCSDTILTEVTRMRCADAVESFEPDVAAARLRVFRAGAAGTATPVISTC